MPIITGKNVLWGVIATIHYAWVRDETQNWFKAEGSSATNTSYLLTKGNVIVTKSLNEGQNYSIILIKWMFRHGDGAGISLSAHTHSLKAAPGNLATLQIAARGYCSIENLHFNKSSDGVVCDSGVWIPQCCWFPVMASLGPQLRKTLFHNVMLEMVTSLVEAAHAVSIW